MKGGAFFGTARIGVLGGIGPEATAGFYSRLIKRLHQKQKRCMLCNSDLPQVIINSIPAPELVHDSVSSADLESYFAGLRELDRIGVDFIVMVCNTIHLFRKQLQQAVEAPIIDLRSEVRGLLSKRKVGSVLVLGTPLTVKCGLYEFRGVRTMKPTDAELERLSAAILDFNNGIAGEKQFRTVDRIAGKYVMQGAETVIAGCTELALMLDSRIPHIDPMDVLIDAAVRRIV